MKHRVLVLFMAAFGLLILPVYAQHLALETKPTPQIKELQGVITTLFAPLIKQDSETFLKKLFEIFPIGERARAGFGDDLKTLGGRLSFPAEVEFVGYRTVGNSERYFVVYYLSMHPEMPVGWELTFYQPQAGKIWQLNFLRYHSDDLYEFMQLPKMQFEALQKQLNDEGNRLPPPLNGLQNVPAPTQLTIPTVTPEPEAKPAPVPDSAPASDSGK